MPKKLLLADDSVTIQRVIELTFSGEDVTVLAVGDGEEAIARIPAEKPDIILADIGMPKRSGYEVSAFVKSRPELAHIPVLLLAGAFEPVDDAKAREAGCDGVLVKPFEPQQVIARVRELIGGAKGSPTQSAVSDIPRPAAALAPSRPVELPRREERRPIPEDLMDIGEDDLLPRESDLLPRETDLMPQVEDVEVAAHPVVMDDSLDDYFDKLDEAFSTINTTSPTGAQTLAADARPPRPDRPVLERDLESFDEPLIIDAPLAQFGEPLAEFGEPPRAEVDPFAGIDAIQPEDANIPTLDDLLGGMSAEPHKVESTFEPMPAPSKVERVIDFPAPPPPAAVPPPIVVAPLAPAPPPRPAPVVSTPPAPSRVEGPAPSRVEGLEASSGRSIIADAFTALLAAEQGEPGAAPVRLAGNGSAPAVTDTMIDDVAKRVIERLALGSSDQMHAIVKEIVSGVAERLVREEIERIRNKA